MALWGKSLLKVMGGANLCGSNKQMLCCMMCSVAMAAYSLIMYLIVHVYLRSYN